ncbi:MAG: IS1 family transposase [Microcoleus sp.]
MKLDLSCPTCGSDDIMKNGTTRRGKQNHKCRDCGRQFVENPQWKPKDKDTIALVKLLLLEKIPLAGIVRAVGVSASWLLALCQQILSTGRAASRSSAKRKREADGSNRRVVVICGQ